MIAKPRGNMASTLGVGDFAELAGGFKKYARRHESFNSKGC